MEELETIKGDDGFTAKIYYDQDAQNPCRDRDYLGLIYIKRREGSKETASIRGLDEAIYDACNCGGIALFLEACDRSGAVSVRDRLKLRYDLAECDTKLSDEDQADGADGVTWASREAIQEEFGKVTRATKDKAAKILEMEIREYSQWASGEVYGIVIEDSDGNDVDSCWGFYGWDYAQEQAKEMLQTAIESAREDQANMALMQSTEGAGI